MSTLVIAVASIILSVAAQFSLKAGMSSIGVKTALGMPYTIQTLFAVLTNPYILGGFILYGVGAFVWLGVLSRWDVSKAYPLVGLGFLLTIVVGFLVGEQISFVRAIGVTLICLGVFLVSRS